LGAKPEAVIERDGNTSRVYGTDDIGIFGTPKFGAKPIEIITDDE
jgi:hypothetical protein